MEDINALLRECITKCGLSKSKLFLYKVLLYKSYHGGLITPPLYDNLLIDLYLGDSIDMISKYTRLKFKKIFEV